MIPLLLIVTFLMSFLFAGSEIGFTSLNRMLVDVWVKDRRPGARLTRWFIVNPENFLSTTLVGNNVAIITFTTLAVFYFLNYGLTEGETYIYASLLIILFTEMVPKILFKHYHNYLFPATSLLVGLFYILFWPAVVIARQAARLLSRLAASNEQEEQGIYERNSMRALFEGEFDEQLLDEEALAIIRNVVELPEHSAREVLTPRVDVIALSEEMTLEEAIPLVQKSGFSKFPVYREDIDHITGYVAVRDFFLMPERINDIVRPAEFIPQSVPLLTLLKSFGRQQLNLAVVLDEHGGTAGIITHEDLAEELFGDITDEHDREITWIRQLDPRRWLVNTRMELDDFFEELRLPVPDSNYETLGGWIIDRNDGIPAPGERIEVGGLSFQVVRANSQRLWFVILELHEELAVAIRTLREQEEQQINNQEG